MAERPLPREHHLPVERTARLYSLGGEDPTAVREIWIVAHGYSQLARDFIVPFATIAGPQCLVVAPEALNRYYVTAGTSTPAHERQVGATWMTRDDRERDISDYVGYLDAVLARAESMIGGRTVPVRVLGFSQGAATISRWAARSHRLAAAEVILWGGPLPSDIDLSAGSAVFGGAPVTLVVGDRDQYVTAEVVEKEVARLDEAGIRHRLVRFPGGHALSRDVLRELAGTHPGA